MLHPSGLIPADAGRKLASRPDEKPGDRQARGGLWSPLDERRGSRQIKRDIGGAPVRTGGADHFAAKCGIFDLVETLAIEEAASSVRVDAVEAGMILTPKNARAEDNLKFHERPMGNILMSRATELKEVTALVRWLPSDQATYSTRVRVPIDGGLSLMQALGA